MLESIFEGVVFVFKKVFEARDEAKLDELKIEIAEVVAQKLLQTHQRIDNVETLIKEEMYKLISQNRQTFHVEGNLLIFHHQSPVPRKDYLDKVLLNEGEYIPYEEIDEGTAKLIDTPQNPELGEWHKMSDETLKRIKLRRKGLLNE